jgi:hypothetical protein
MSCLVDINRISTHTAKAPSTSLLAPHFGPPEVIDLEETSEALALLLRFMHKVQYPDTAQLSDEKLFALADAAEKWRVLSAVAICNAHIMSNPYVSLSCPFRAVA